MLSVGFFAVLKPPLKGEVAREMTVKIVVLRKIRVTVGFVVSPHNIRF